MARKQTAWITLVKQTLKENPGKSFKQALKIAKKSYKKSASASSKGVRKSRRHNKTKRGGSAGSSSQDPQNQNGQSQDEGSKQHGGGANSLLDLVGSKGKSPQTGGSGGGSSTGKPAFGENAGTV
jgi:hypothetical protein